MPSKIQNDVNLWFLYICLQKSDYKSINFNAVAEAANINPPAARMRFTRLKKAIESGTLDTLEGTNPSRSISASDSVQQNPVSGICKREVSQEKTPNIIMTEAPQNSAGPARAHPVLPDKAVKRESSDGDTDLEDDDDVPLATKRRIALACSGTNKARKLGHDGPPDSASTARNTRIGNAMVGVTSQPSPGSAIAPTVTTMGRAGVLQYEMLNAGVVADRAEEELRLRRTRSAATRTTPHILPNKQGAANYPTSTRAKRSLGLWDIASERAEMVNGQMPDIAAGEYVSGSAGINRPSRSGFTRYTGLSGPNYGTWRGYRIPTITVTDIDANTNADNNTPARGNDLTYMNTTMPGRPSDQNAP